MRSSRISTKAGRFSESVIREMTRLADQHEAINLAQGFPDFPAPDFIKQAASKAIHQDFNQYAVTWGSPRLRQAISEKYAAFYNWPVDPDREVTVCCGSTESMIATILALVDPGERVLVFEPFYENYGPDTIIAGARPVFASTDPERGWSLDLDNLTGLFGQHADKGGVRAMILNSPNNPTGHVFSLEELAEIAKLAREFGCYVITDEIYEHILYEGHRHHPIALLPGMKDRTVTISGLSKTFSVTGWRIGYVIAPPDLTDAIRKMHDFLTVGAAAPLQEAAASALGVEEEYYRNLAQDYETRRDRLHSALEEAGFGVSTPYGSYYIMADISELTDQSDVQFVERLIKESGVAAVPGSSFFRTAEDGRNLVRFTFCKTLELIDEVGKRLLKLRTGS